MLFSCILVKLLSILSHDSQIVKILQLYTYIFFHPSTVHTMVFAVCTVYLPVIISLDPSLLKLFSFSIDSFSPLLLQLISNLHISHCVHHCLSLLYILILWYISGGYCIEFYWLIAIPCNISISFVTLWCSKTFSFNFNISIVPFWPYVFLLHFGIATLGHLSWQPECQNITTVYICFILALCIRQLPSQWMI